MIPKVINVNCVFVEMSDDNFVTYISEKGLEYSDLKVTDELANKIKKNTDMVVKIMSCYGITKIVDIVDA